MKKTILFFAAAAVALVACNKTEFTGPEAEGEQPVSFRIAVNNLTKAKAPFTGTDPSGAGSIPIVSSSHYSDGTTIAAKAKFDYLRYDGGYWYLADENLNIASTLPLGDTRMDVLAFLGYNNSYDLDYLGSFYFEPSDGGQLQDPYLTAYNYGWNYYLDAGWRPVLTDNTNYANKAYFINVATPQYNHDIMYGSANEIKKGEDRTLTLKHAMAALYFNIAFADAIPTDVAMDPLLFVKLGNPANNLPNTPAYDLYDALVHYDYISSLSGLYFKSRAYYDYLSLKTVGTFIVDNSKNNLEASWYLGRWQYLGTNWDQYYNTSGEGYAYLQNDDESYAMNTVASEKRNLALETYLSSYTLNADTYYQVGAQLVPEQEIVNPWLRYKIGNQIYLTEVNLPRGTWKMGHAYIYNLKLNFNGAKFTVTVEPYEYLTGGHYLEY